MEKPLNKYINLLFIKQYETKVTFDNDYREGPAAFGEWFDLWSGIRQWFDLALIEEDT
jgi:hypothetical protein